MPIKLSKSNISINKVVAQKSEKMLIEGDEIVPDIKPDILSIISSNGNVCIYKKEVQEGKLKIEGSINSYIIYIADDEKSNIRTINANLEFSKVIEIKDLKSTMAVETKEQLLNIDCKILNGRKINLKATVEIELTAYSNEKIDYIDKIEEQEDIQLLNKTMTINSLVGMGSTKVYAKDTLSIDETDNLSEIMKLDFSLENQENKISYNKILAKADLALKIMYLTDDGRIRTLNSSIPTVGFIDIQDISENDISDLSYEVKNILVKPNNSEEHSVYVEIEMEIMCFVYKKLEVNMIQDLYGRKKQLSYTQKDIKIMNKEQQIVEKYSLKKQETVEEIAKNKIYDVEVKPMILSTEIGEGKVTYKGNVNLIFIYSQNENSSVAVKNIVEPFEFDVTSNQINTKTKIQTQIDVTKKDFVIMSDENIDIKLEFEFKLNITKENTIKIIEEIKEEENKDRETFSIVIYYTKQGDTIWKIAKKFGSTVDEIVKINNIENADSIMVGEQLFIPR